jgi:uncharacterized protein RhaS with RHS repeats
MGRYVSADPIGLNGGWNRFGYAGQDGVNYVDPNGLIKIPNIPGAVGETSLHANPGPEATTFRPEHAPNHIHIGANDGPRVSTDSFLPLSEEDAKRMTRKQKDFCRGLAEDSKNKIRKTQQSIFKNGKIILQIQGLGALSIAAACRADPLWCAEQIESGVLP